MYALTFYTNQTSLSFRVSTHATREQAEDAAYDHATDFQTKYGVNTLPVAIYKHVGDQKVTGYHGFLPQDARVDFEVTEIPECDICGTSDETVKAVEVKGHYPGDFFTEFRCGKCN